MRTIYGLQRPREVERLFKSAEGLVAEVIAPAVPGHLDHRSRAAEALRALELDVWLDLGGNNLARKFQAPAQDLEQPIEG